MRAYIHTYMHVYIQTSIHTYCVHSPLPLPLPLPGSVMSALKFGWNSCFVASKERTVSDAELSQIIDRTRGFGDKTATASSETGYIHTFICAYIHTVHAYTNYLHTYIHTYRGPL